MPAGVPITNGVDRFAINQEEPSAVGSLGRTVWLVGFLEGFVC